MSSTGRPGAYPILVFCVLAAAIGGICYALLAPFLTAIAWAIVLAVAFHRPWTWLESRYPSRKNLAAVLLSLAIGVVVVLPAASLVGVLAWQASDIAGRTVAEMRSRNVHGVEDLLALPPVKRVVGFVAEKSGVTPDEIARRAVSFAAEAATFLAQKSGGLLLSFFDAVMTFLMTLFFLFFFLRDGREMTVNILEILPVGKARRERIGSSLFSMLQSIFLGSLLCALAQGVSGAVGWWIAGLPSPALAGAAMAFLSLLPIGGTAIVWLPGTLVLWFTGHHGAAIFLAAWGAIVTSVLFDNVLKPLVIGGSAELDTLVVFVGVFGGLSVFGLLGIFIGPIALALAATLLEVLREQNPRPAAETAGS
jgi:predicted PurR-regulated permease PerM